MEPADGEETEDVWHRRSGAVSQSHGGRMGERSWEHPAGSVVSNGNNDNSVCVSSDLMGLLDDLRDDREVELG